VVFPFVVASPLWLSFVACLVLFPFNELKFVSMMSFISYFMHEHIRKYI
jgi:hypothetical protein